MRLFGWLIVWLIVLVCVSVWVVRVCMCVRWFGHVRDRLLACLRVCARLCVRLFVGSRGCV